MRRADDFRLTTRRGRRAAAGALVVHHLPARAGEPALPAVVGFVVGRAVGNSVVRHRVSRRLRNQTLELLPELGPGSRTVVRALPPAATASSAALGADLRAAHRRLTGTRA